MTANSATRMRSTASNRQARARCTASQTSAGDAAGDQRRIECPPPPQHLGRRFRSSVGRRSAVRACQGFACLFRRVEDIAGWRPSHNEIVGCERGLIGDAEQSALVYRRRPGRAAGGGGRRSRARRGAGARAVWRDQPRHRAARLCRPGARERVSTHARAIHGRGVSRFRSNTVTRPSAGSRTVRRSCGRRTVFALHPHQSLFTVPATAVLPCPTTYRRRARCSRQIWRPRSTRCGMARPDRPIASPSSAAAWSACWSGICARDCRELT